MVNDSYNDLLQKHLSKRVAVKKDSVSKENKNFDRDSFFPGKKMVG